MEKRGRPGTSSLSALGLGGSPRVLVYLPFRVHARAVADHLMLIAARRASFATTDACAAADAGLELPAGPAIVFTG